MAKVLRLEWFRLRKRLATWVVYVTFLTLTAFLFGVSFYSRQPHHHGPYLGFPNAWEIVLTVGAPVASIFGAVLVALTVSSEFEWKTTRQNIIDGLSKQDWFLGKLALIPAVCVALYGTQVIFGTVWAYLDTYPPHRLFYYPAATYVTAALGVLLGMFWYSAVALLISVMVRSSGAAIGLTLIYQVFDNIVAGTLRGYHFDHIAAWLPFQVHNSLLQFNQYWPQPSPTLEDHWATGDLLLAGVLWATLFTVAARSIYQRPRPRSRSRANPRGRARLSPRAAA
ncbi:MAG: ABC transporter permease [Steroidobacteraceae bacterium]